MELRRIDRLRLSLGVVKTKKGWPMGDDARYLLYRLILLAETLRKWLTM